MAKGSTPAWGEGVVCRCLTDRTTTAPSCHPPPMDFGSATRSRLLTELPWKPIRGCPGRLVLDGLSERFVEELAGPDVPRVAAHEQDRPRPRRDCPARGRRAHLVRQAGRSLATHAGHAGGVREEVQAARADPGRCLTATGRLEPVSSPRSTSCASCRYRRGRGRSARPSGSCAVERGEALMRRSRRSWLDRRLPLRLPWLEARPPLQIATVSFTRLMSRRAQGSGSRISFSSPQIGHSFVWQTIGVGTAKMVKKLGRG